MSILLVKAGSKHTPEILISLRAIIYRALCLEGDKHSFLHCVVSRRTVRPSSSCL